MRDIRNMVSSVKVEQYQSEEEYDRGNKKQPMCFLDFDATMTWITGYDARRRAVIIKRWWGLETGEVSSAHKLPQSFAAAGR